MPAKKADHEYNNIIRITYLPPNGWWSARVVVGLATVQYCEGSGPTPADAIRALLRTMKRGGHEFDQRCLHPAIRKAARKKPPVKTA